MVQVMGVVGVVQVMGWWVWSRSWGGECGPGHGVVGVSRSWGGGCGPGHGVVGKLRVVAGREQERWWVWLRMAMPSTHSWIPT